jgi:hypothetical protein
MMLKLLIVIINYKTPELVINLMQSLIPELIPDETKVVIVDNDSNDGSIDKLSSWIEGNNQQGFFELIEAGHNYGFSGGNNIGIKHEDAENYLLINSDTLVRPSTIETLLTAVKDNPEVGLFSPRLEWENGVPQQSCFNYHSPVSELINSAATGPITKAFSNFVVAQPVKNTMGYYQWTSFACVLIRKQVFEDIGLMDADYFMYYEDVAFSRKAQEVGWKVMNVPKARVVHLRGGTSSVKEDTKLRRRIPRYFFESRTRYFYQFYGRVGLFFANILWTLGWLIGTFRSLITKGYTSNASRLQWIDIWTNFFNPTEQYIHPSRYKK